MRNILLENVTIRNFTKNGIKIAGINNLKINKCDISDNGSNVVPGPGFHHNVNLSHADSCIITNNRFDSSLWGNGISIICCNDFKIANNEFARNKLSGIYCAESNDIILESNWIEGNDQYGIKIDQLMDGCENIVLRQNLVQNNAFKGVFIYNSNSITIQENKLLNNGCIKK